ncbi:MAG: hypothetical protein HN967_12655 [Candidatus Marinimicrobia bacterium]|nr:hypothetical protein [Candidatus Neomarinimicrobiota bacterium]
MSRTIRIYNPEERRFLEDNLYCTYCGNANAFQIDLKLKHLLKSESGCVSVELLKSYSDRVMNIIKNNVDKLLEKGFEGKPRFRCANCNEDQSLDLQGRVYDYCSYNFCPGCFTCGIWIEKDDLINMCTECITEKEGEVEDEDCIYNCPNYDNGLSEAMDHYSLSLQEIKKNLGY